MRNPRVQVTMDDALYDYAFVVATRESRTVANLCRHALRAYLSKMSRGELPAELRTGHRLTKDKEK